MAYIDAHRHDVVEGREVGVEPICAVLKSAGVQVAPSGYYASKTREPSARSQRAGQDVTGLVHHSDRGVQHRAIRYTERLAEALNSLFKAEYVDWFNHRRLHGELKQIPPAEVEANHWASKMVSYYVETPAPATAGSSGTSLHETRWDSTER